MVGMTEHDDSAVDDYLASLDEATRKDAETLTVMLRRISGVEPTLWNAGTLGFGTYHYKYDSGREGDGHIIGFYPRKGKTTVYLMDGTARHADLLARLGTHSETGYCIYLKQLSDVDQPILEQIVRASFEYIETLADAGPIDHILWKAEPGASL
jgi:hypothetical protein